MKDRKTIRKQKHLNPLKIVTWATGPPTRGPQVPKITICVGSMEIKIDRSKEEKKQRENIAEPLA